MPAEPSECTDAALGRTRLAAFLRPDCHQRLFTWPIGHPAQPTGFCFCEHGRLAHLRIVARSLHLRLACALPSNRYRLAVLRRHGLVIGDPVFISVGCFIDPVFPHLISIEPEVFLGLGAQLFTHEYRRDQFRAGRVILRRGAFIGGGAVIACGVEIGAGATVAAGAWVGRDVPAGCTALGNPARIVPQGNQPCPV